MHDGILVVERNLPQRHKAVLVGTREQGAVRRGKDAVRKGFRDTKEAAFARLEVNYAQHGVLDQVDNEAVADGHEATRHEGVGRIEELGERRHGEGIGE